MQLLELFEKIDWIKMLTKKASLFRVVNNLYFKNKIGFLQIPDVVEKSMKMIPLIANPVLVDYFETEKLTRLKATELLGNYHN